MIKYAAITNAGMEREVNQDFFYANGEAPPTFIVCDGMGGHAAGDIASRSAVQSISKYIKMHISFDMDARKAKTLLEGACKYANTLVLSRAKSAKQYSGMGTTADICLFDFDVLYICHVGDSRVYRCRGGALTQITKDHSLINDLLDNGTITPEEARTHPNRHMITRAVGTDEDLKCDFHIHELEDGDIILMCSDGLSNMLSDEQMKNTLLRFSDLDGAAKALVDKANENGGTDNITAVIIKYNEEESR